MKAIAELEVTQLQRTMQFVVERPCPDSAALWSLDSIAMLPVVVFVDMKPFPSNSCQGKGFMVANPDLGQFAVRGLTGGPPYVCEHMGRFIE